MHTIEQVYVGVRECENNRKAITILVHMLFIARQSGSCAYGSEARLWDTMGECVSCE
jgi:hypothetical protein